MKIEILTQAADNYRQALKNHYDASLVYIEAQTNLKEAQLNILMENADDPKKLGSNEAIRQATLDNMTKDLKDTFEVANRRLKETDYLKADAKVAYDTAKLVQESLTLREIT